jgi:hypothetical protein
MYVVAGVRILRSPHDARRELQAVERDICRNGGVGEAMANIPTTAPKGAQRKEVAPPGFLLAGLLLATECRSTID